MLRGVGTKRHSIKQYVAYRIGFPKSHHDFEACDVMGHGVEKNKQILKFVLISRDVILGLHPN